MQHKLLSRLRDLIRDSDGTSVIEFALLAPILAITLMGVTESHVTVTTRLECDHVPQPLFDGTCLPNQMISRYVGVSIAYTYRPIFFEGPLAAFGDSNGNVALAAASSVRVQ